MAEAIFKHKIENAGLGESYFADSCGTANYHIGDSPDLRTIRCTVNNGVPIQHAARQLSLSDLIKFDLVLAMDQRNYQNIVSLATSTEDQKKVKLMREFDPMGMGDVPDPYYGGENDFEEVFKILDRSIDQMIREITQINSSPEPGV
jgi:protein-tyrosine phosphatase